MKMKQDKFPLIIIVCGILFTLYLQSQITNETFFSGDGSLKALLAKQFSTGNFRFDLDLPAEAWVRQLWDSGLYPFGNTEPFIYHQANRYYIPFPFTFPLVSAPFYALFGFKGLYIIPLVSLWAIWFTFYSVCQRLKLGNTLTSLALATLIFSSPLTLYGAMYWEHTLAVALAFQGLATVLVPSSGELSRKEALLSGVLIGLSIWFREELLCIVGIMLLLAYGSSKINFIYDLILLFSGLLLGLFVLVKEEPLWFIGIICLLAYASSKTNFALKNKEIFLGSMLLTIFLLWAINIIIYHHPLGIHALQVVKHLSLRSRANDALKYFKIMNLELFYYLPLLFLPILYIILSLFNKKVRLRPSLRILFLIYTLFSFSVPLLLPSEGGRQWGPRFLLILIPVISLLVILTLQAATRVSSLSLRYIFVGIFIVFFTIGIYQNTYLGSVYLSDTYKTSPVLNFLRKNPDKVVATTHEFVSQSLVPIFGQQKIFFLTKSNENLISLGAALEKRGYKHFVYICHPYHPCYSPEGTPNQLEFTVEGKPLLLKFSPIGKIDDYLLYDSSLLENLTPSIKSS